MPLDHGCRFDQHHGVEYLWPNSVSHTQRNEDHFRGVLTTRAHLWLNKDCPQPRHIQPPVCRQDYCVPGGRWSASSLRTPRRVSYCGDRTQDPLQRGGRSFFATVSLGSKCAQNPCMAPRSQQRPMFYSTDQKSLVAIFICKPSPRPDRFLSRDRLSSEAFFQTF